MIDAESDAVAARIESDRRYPWVAMAVGLPAP